MKTKIMFDYSKLLGKIKEKGLTLAEFAKMIGISSTTLSLVLSNGAFLRQPIIIKACNVLGIDRKEIPSYFFTLKVQKN